MSNLSQFIRNEHQSLLASRATQAALLRSSRLLTSFIIVVLALLLGAVMAVMTMMPTSWMAVSVLAICATGGLLVWFWAELPLLPILSYALIFSLSFRLEINFFVINKAHEAPPGINISLTMILALSLLLVRFSDHWMRKYSERVCPTSYTITYWLLFVWCSIAVIYSGETQLGIYALAGLLTSGAIGYAATAAFSHPSAIRKAILITALTVGASGLLGALQYLFGFATDWKILGSVAEDDLQKIADGDVSRVAGLLTMANAFGWFLVTFLPIMIAPILLHFRGFRLWEKLLLLGATGLGTISLILTFARGSWISFVLSMMLLGVLIYRATHREERSAYLWRLGGILILVIMMALPFAPMIYTRLTEDDRGAAQSRVPLMQVAMNMIADNPVFGVGLSNYELEQRRYDDTEERILDDFDWPVHNVFLHIAAESGVPSLLLLLLLIGLAVKAAWPVLQHPDPMLGAMAAGLMTGLMAYLTTGMKELGSLGSGQHRFMFFMIGMLLAVARASQRTDSLADKAAG